MVFGAVVFAPLLLTMGNVFVLDGDATEEPGVVEPAPLTEIDSCTTISEPGRYVLTADIVDDKGTHLSERCIHIKADDVVLDGAGHRVDGRGVSGTVGVYVSSSEPLTNVSVTRLTVSDWDWGVHYEGVSGGEVRAVTANYNGAGVSLTETRSVTVADNEVSNNAIGIYLLDSADNTIRHNAVSANHLGVDCEGSDGNTLAANTIGSNQVTGSTAAC